MAPAADFETLISLAVSGGGGGGDRKVACETTFNTATTTAPGPYDLPAESFCVPVDQQLDWIDWNHATPVYERDDSTKGPSNPKSTNHQSNHSTSQHFSGNLRRMDPIIGLPRKLRIDLLGHSSRHTGRGPRMTPRKKATTVPGSEPASPKVSCIGKVRSDRERGVQACGKGRNLLSRLLRFFACCGGCHRREAEREAEEVGRSVAGESPAAAAAVSAPAGIGAMKKFASGRSWASLELDDVDRSGMLDGGLHRRSLEVDDVEVSEPLDGGIRPRRGAGALEAFERGKRPLAGDVGPKSV